MNNAQWAVLLIAGLIALIIAGSNVATSPGLQKLIAVGKQIFNVSSVTPAPPTKAH